ncbi:MAG: hypothetical protein J7M40_00665 [Planctomycetes bacterium]|nr:hypothetical protein [Planctomycetota bacterium]
MLKYIPDKKVSDDLKVTDKTAPHAPSGLNVSGSGGTGSGRTFSWTGVTDKPNDVLGSGLEKYVLKLDGVQKYSGKSTSVTVSGMTGGNHTWQVEAWDRNGNKSLASGRKFTIVDTTAPGTVNNALVDGTAQGIQLTWDNPADSDFEGVIIIRRASQPVTRGPSRGRDYSVGNSLGGGTIVYVGSGESFADTGLIIGTKYYYSIHAFDRARNYSDATIGDATAGYPKKTIFDVIDFRDGIHSQIGDFIGAVVGASWDNITGYLNDRLEIAPDATVGFKIGFEVAGLAGEGAYVDIASAGIGMSVAYSLADETWTLARGISVDFLGDKFGLAGEEYIVLPIDPSIPVTVGLGLTGSYSLFAPPEVKLGINKAVSVTVGIGGGIGTSLSIGIDTKMSQSQFLTRTGQSTLGFAALDSFGLLSSDWVEWTLDNLGRVTPFGLPILSALGVGDDPLALLSSSFLGGSYLHTSVKQATSADMSLQLNAGIGAGLGVGVSATAYIGVFASADLGVVTVWEDEFSLAALTPPDDVGNSASTATTLAAHTDYERMLSQSDKDFYAFDSAPNQYHEFNIAPGTASELVAVIQDTDGNVFKRQVLSGTAKTIGFWANSSGQYFLSLEGTRGTTFGQYSLTWAPDIPDGTFTAGLVGFGSEGSVRLVELDPGDYAVRLEEHSPASITTTIEVPEVAPTLSFQYRLAGIGDGDQMEVKIDSTLIWSVPIDSAQGSFIEIGPLDLSAYAGETVELTFYLDSVGEANAVFDVDGIEVGGADSYTFYSTGSSKVTVYRLGGGGMAEIAENVQVKFGRDDSILSVTLGRDLTISDIGIVISDAPYVGKISDERRGQIGTVAFIASEAPIRAVDIRGSITGFNLNGLELGGIIFPEDIDGDGDVGDLTALYISGQDARGYSTKRLSVKGGILDSEIVVTGAFGNITMPQWTNGSLTAQWASIISIRGNRKNVPTGDFGATLNLTGQDKRGMSLNRLQVAGKILDSQITLAGAAGTIMAAQWDSGSLNATWAKNIITKGKRADRSGAGGIVGDLGATLNLTGQDKRGMSLNKLQVAGTARNSTVRTAGNMGSILLGATDGSDFLAGIKNGVARYATSHDDFDNPVATIKSVKIKGIKGTTGRFFEDTNLSASSLETVSILNADFVNGECGLYAKEIRRVTYRDTESGEKWSWPVKGLQIFSGPDEFIQILL